MTMANIYLLGKTLLVVVLCNILKPNAARKNETTYPCGPCACSIRTAYCNDKGLTYIPQLPSNVTLLYFNNNKLTSINASTLAPLSKLNLTALHIRQNKLVNVSIGTFASLTHLEILDLGKNEHLNKTSLAESLGSLSKSLKKLKLDNIGLEKTNGMFIGLKGSTVSTINLQSNRIQHLNLKEFEHVGNLTKLILVKNWIQNIQAKDFTLPELLDLNLADNEIAKFSPFFCPKSPRDKPLYLKLSNIDLSNNFINVLNSESWSCLSSLSKLSLSGNIITHLKANMFSKLPKLQTLELSNMKGRIKYIDASALNSSSLVKLNLGSNDIHFYKLQFPEDLFKHCPSLTTLNLYANSFRHISDDNMVKMLSHLKSVENLTLSYSKLSRIPKGLLWQMPKLSSLNLDGNSLETLNGAFTNATSVRNLTVTDNNLGAPTQDSFPFELMAQLTSLNVAFNPFQCTCDLLWFKSFIGNTGMIGKNTTLEKWPQGYQCNSPPDMVKKELASYNPTKKSCAAKRILLMSLLSSCTVVLVSICIAIAVYRNIWYIRYWRYKLNRSRSSDPEMKPLLERTKYDAYVIYTDDDGPFVHGDLRQLLEEQLKYKLFIWHRDSEVGAANVDTMADALYASNRVLAIVSSSFLKDGWCKFQLDVSVNKQIEDKKELVTFVVLEDLDYMSLRKSWCVLLTKMKTSKYCKDDTKIKGRLFLEEMKQQLNG